MTSNQPDLDAIEALTTNEHLTPGPWTLDRESCDCSDGYCRHGMYVTGVVTPVPTEIAAERCKRTGEQPRDYDFHRGDIGDFTEADWELMVAAREAMPALVDEVRRLRARVDRAHQAMAERLAEVAEREADGMLPFGTPGASWCDAVTVTCARIEDALRDLPEPLHVPVAAV